MERPLRTAAAVLALAVPASAQLHFVQKTPAEIGAAMTLEVTNAVPGTPLYLLGWGALGPVPGGSPLPLGVRMILPLGTSNGSGALTVALPIPDSSALLGQVLPMRIKGFGAAPGGGALSNPLAAWFGAHPVSVSPTPESSGSFGWSVAIGDFVGTSAVDVAVGAVLETVSGAFGAGKVHIFVGPSFTSITTITSPAPSIGGDFGWALTALDWNGDGATDLAVGEPGKDGLFPLTNIGAVHVFVHPVGSAGVSTYTDPTPVALEQMGVSLAAATLDLTPSDELVVGASFHGASQPPGVFAKIKILGYTGGIPTFSEVSDPTLAEGLFGHCVAAGDVDGDGFDEILVGEPNHDEPGAFDCGAVHLFDGGVLSLTLIDDAPATGEKLGTSVAIGDVDGDGLGDLLTGVLLENQAQLYLAPSFTAATPILLPPAHPGDIHGGRAVAVADVNGDGKLDALVAAGSCTGPGFGVVCGSVTAYLGLSLAATAYVADSEILPWSLATGDVDGDGRAEIAVGHPGAAPMFLSGAGAFLLSE